MKTPPSPPCSRSQDTLKQWGLKEDIGQTTQGTDRKFLRHLTLSTALLLEAGGWRWMDRGSHGLFWKSPLCLLPPPMVAQQKVHIVQRTRRRLTKELLFVARGCPPSQGSPQQGVCAEPAVTGATGISEVPLDFETGSHEVQADLRLAEDDLELTCPPSTSQVGLTQQRCLRQSP